MNLGSRVLENEARRLIQGEATMKIVKGKFKRGYGNAIGRWATVGPYYAMFPLDFAFDVVHQYSKTRTTCS